MPFSSLKWGNYQIKCREKMLNQITVTKIKNWAALNKVKMSVILIHVLWSFEYKGFICLCNRTDVDAVVDEIARKEPLITASKTEQVRKLVQSRCSHSQNKSVKSHNMYKVGVGLIKQVRKLVQKVQSQWNKFFKEYLHLVK